MKAQHRENSAHLMFEVTRDWTRLVTLWHK